MLYWISLVPRRLEHHDQLIQAAITVAGAFACYYVSEVILGVSGVLAIICAGAECAFFMWPLVCNRAALEHLWHFLEWLFNTALFELAGLIIGGRCLLRVELSWNPEWAGRDHDSGIDLADLALVGFTFVAAIAIRFIAVFSLLPLLRRLGYGFWGGLRGAVGLALALSMEHTLAEQGRSRTGSLVLLHTSGVVVGSLVINAPTMPALLRCLGLSGKEDRAQARAMLDVRRRVEVFAEREFANLKQHPKAPTGEAWKFRVVMAVSALRRATAADTILGGKTGTHDVARLEGKEGRLHASASPTGRKATPLSPAMTRRETSIDIWSPQSDSYSMHQSRHQSASNLRGVAVSRESSVASSLGEPSDVRGEGRASVASSLGEQETEAQLKVGDGLQGVPPTDVCGASAGAAGAAGGGTQGGFCRASVGIQMLHRPPPPPMLSGAAAAARATMALGSDLGAPEPAARRSVVAQEAASEPISHPSFAAWKKPGDFRKSMSFAPAGEVAPSGELMRARQIFLNLVKQSYHEQLAEGLLPARSIAAFELSNSVDVAADRLYLPLTDWTTLVGSLEMPLLPRALARLLSDQSEVGHAKAGPEPGPGERGAGPSSEGGEEQFVEGGLGGGGSDDVPATTGGGASSSAGGGAGAKRDVVQLWRRLNEAVLPGVPRSEGEAAAAPRPASLDSSSSSSSRPWLCLSRPLRRWLRKELLRYDLHASYLVTCYITAHESAQQEMRWVFGSRKDFLHAEEKKVVAESRASVASATTFLRELAALPVGPVHTQAGFRGGRGAVLLKEVATRQLIAVLLTRVERFIESMRSHGVIDADGAAELLHEVSRDRHALHRRHVVKQLSRPHEGLELEACARAVHATQALVRRHKKVSYVHPTSGGSGAGGSGARRKAGHVELKDDEV